MATVPASLNPSFLAPKAPNRTTAFSLPKPFLNLPRSSSSSSSLCRLRRRRLALTLLASSVKDHLGRLYKTWSDVTSLNHWVVRDYCRLVSSVNALEPQIKRLSDEQLTAKTEEFRRRLSQGETLGDIQAESFAVVREAARRKLGMRHFDVQIIGGAVLRDGSIAEMNTGEGKTLVSTLAAYLNALSGDGVHVARTSQQEEVQISLEEPMSDLENETKSRALRARFLLAALKDDWEAGDAFIKKNPNFDIALPLTKVGGTALHNAASANSVTFVKELVKLMDSDDLKLKTSAGSTALMSAASSGSVAIARVLVGKEKSLPDIPANSGRTPLGAAAGWGPGYKEMVSYLFSVTDYEQLSPSKRTQLFRDTISSDMFDTALKILEKKPKLLPEQPAEQTPTSENQEINPAQLAWDALEMLASKSLAFGTTSERCQNACFNMFSTNKASMRTLAHQLVEKLWLYLLNQQKLLSIKAMAENHMALLAEAAKVGNVEFLVILLRSYPYLLWEPNLKYGSLFHIAISYRQENVFNLIYEIGNIKNFVASLSDGKQNNMLHLAGHLAPPERLNIVPGAALQMQRELLWFEEIEKIVPPSFANMKIIEGDRELTPKDLFRKKHRALQEAGEKWMKDTANSCMLVATLIATVVFAATFTVPGGLKQETGIPIFLENKWFTVFFVSVAIALLSSSSSILIFLSILTSRYTEKDFLDGLPIRLVLGLFTLFISIVSMVIAFSATCFLVYNSKSGWVPAIIFAAAGIPISLFIWFRRDLWVDIICSAFNSRDIFGKKDRLFYLGEDDDDCVIEVQGAMTEPLT